MTGRPTWLDSRRGLRQTGGPRNWPLCSWAFSPPPGKGGGGRSAKRDTGQRESRGAAPRQKYRAGDARNSRASLRSGFPFPRLTDCMQCAHTRTHVTHAGCAGAYMDKQSTPTYVCTCSAARGLALVEEANPSSSHLRPRRASGRLRKREPATSPLPVGCPHRQRRSGCPIHCRPSRPTDRPTRHPRHDRGGVAVARPHNFKSPFSRSRAGLTARSLAGGRPARSMMCSSATRRDLISAVRRGMCAYIACTE